MFEPTAEQLANRKRNTEHLAQLRAEQALRDRAPEIPALEARITELQHLAADILGTFTPGSDGYRARASKIQITRWEAIAKGTAS